MKIVIVGGGTAGWMTALSLVRTHSKNHEIVLVESKKIGIIGAGEGSTSLLHNFVTDFWFNTGINFNEFVEKCNVTPKMGIKHINWTGDGSEYFAPLDGSSTSGMAPDIEFCQALIDDPSKFHVASNLGRMYEAKQIAGSSYHFDAHKISEYFSDIAIRSGVKHIDAEVWSVKTNPSEYITEIVCHDGTTIDGDFFIDCTGFKRCLMGAMDVKWLSYKNNLPVDSAISFQKPLDENWEPLTTARAMNAGWCWEIPTRERYGCGYVYSSKFINKYQALKEIRDHYGDVEIIKEFQFESGRSEVFWKNNCLSLGLSSVFLEPLEATSIHSTIIQAMTFVMEYLTDSVETTVVKERIDNYNKTISRLCDDLKDFIVIHYLGGRTDTPFWQYISEGNTSTEKTDYILNLCKTRVPSSASFDHYFGCAGSMLYNWILAGIKKLTPEVAKNTLNMYDNLYR